MFPPRCIFVEFLDLNKKIIEKMRTAGVDFGNVERTSLPQVLVGKAVVVTGSLAGFSREEAEAAVKLRGGKSPGRPPTHGLFTKPVLKRKAEMRELKRQLAEFNERLGAFK